MLKVYRSLYRVLFSVSFIYKVGISYLHIGKIREICIMIILPVAELIDKLFCLLLLWSKDCFFFPKKLRHFRKSEGIHEICLVLTILMQYHHIRYGHGTSLVIYGMVYVELLIKIFEGSTFLQFSGIYRLIVCRINRQSSVLQVLQIFKDDIPSVLSFIRYLIDCIC